MGLNTRIRVWFVSLVMLAPLAHGNEEFPAYEFSTVEETRDIVDPDHIVLLSPVRIIGGTLRSQDILRASVEGKRRLLEAGPAHSTDEVFGFYLSELKQRSAQILFQCSSRTCGRSNDWANVIFKEAKLYGADREQHYVVARLENGAQPELIVVYVSERGNRRIYAAIDQLSIVNTETPELVADTVGLRGVFVFPFEVGTTIRVTPDGRQASEILRLVTDDESIGVYLVGHQVLGYDSVASARANSLQAAESARAWFVNRGIPLERMEVLGMGPLGANKEPERTMNRVEVILISGPSR